MIGLYSPNNSKKYNKKLPIKQIQKKWTKQNPLYTYGRAMAIYTHQQYFDHNLFIPSPIWLIPKSNKNKFIGICPLEIGFLNSM